MFFLSFHRRDRTPGCSTNKREASQHLSPLDAPDQSGRFENDHLLLVQCVTRNAVSAAPEPAPPYDPWAKIHVTAGTRIDNRGELAWCASYFEGSDRSHLRLRTHLQMLPQMSEDRDDCSENHIFAGPDM